MYTAVIRTLRARCFWRQPFFPVTKCSRYSIAQSKSHWNRSIHALEEFFHNTVQLTASLFVHICASFEGEKSSEQTIFLDDVAHRKLGSRVGGGV